MNRFFGQLLGSRASVTGRKDGLSSLQHNCSARHCHFDNYRGVMKKGNRINRLVHAGVICAMAFACFYQPTVAAEAAKDVSKEISNLRGLIASARVYIVPNSKSYRTRLTELDAMRVGCEYGAFNKSDVDSLLTVLEDAQFTERQEDKYGFEARIVVHLRTHDNVTVPLVLNREFPTAPAMGTYDKSPVVAKIGFGEKLRSWKVQRNPINSTSEACLD
jgi:hypothetical protein